MPVSGHQQEDHEAALAERAPTLTAPKQDGAAAESGAREDAGVERG